MPLDLILTNFEKFGALIGIASYILLIISAQQAKENIIQQQSDAHTNVGPNDSTKTAATSSWLRLFTFLILATIAYIRLREREQRIESGMETSSATPNLNITIGSWIVVIGFLLVSIGAQQRSEQTNARITLI